MFSKKTKLKLTDFECNLLINEMNKSDMFVSRAVCSTNKKAAERLLFY